MECGRWNWVESMEFEMSRRRNLRLEGEEGRVRVVVIHHCCEAGGIVVLGCRVGRMRR